MNASAQTGTNQEEQDVEEQMRKNAAKVAGRIAKARTAADVRAVLAELPNQERSCELIVDDVARLTREGEARALDLAVEEGLARAASPDEARALLPMINEAPERTEDEQTRKRNHTRRVLQRAGEMELGRATTVRLVEGFTARLQTPEYRAANQEDTEEIRDLLQSAANVRLSAMRRSRRRFALASLAWLALGPLLVIATQAPVVRVDIIRFNALFQFMDDRTIPYTTRYLPGAFKFGLIHHPFMMAVVPIFITVILTTNRIPGNGIDWSSALSSNGMAKLLAIAAWIWLFTVLLTHP